MSVPLPPGFFLDEDEDKLGLPPGFVMDAPAPTFTQSLSEGINTLVPQGRADLEKYGYREDLPWERQSRRFRDYYEGQADSQMQERRGLLGPFAEADTPENLANRARALAKKNDFKLPSATPAEKMTGSRAFTSGAASIGKMIPGGNQLTQSMGSAMIGDPSIDYNALLEEDVTQAVKDRPVTTRLGQAAALVAPGEMIYSGLTKGLPRLLGAASPKAAAKLAGDTLLKKGLHYTGRGGALLTAGATENYLYNTAAESANQSRVEGKAPPTFGERIDYANENAFTPQGLINSAVPLGISVGYRTGRGIVTAGKNTVQATAAANKAAPKPEVMAAGLGKLPDIKWRGGSFTPADVQARVAFANTVDPNTGKTLRQKVIDDFLDQGFDPDQAETAVRLAAYNGMSDVPEALFEISPALQEIAVVAGRLHGKPAQKMLQQMFADRKDEFPNALREALRKATGASGDDFEKFVASMKQAGRDAADPGYKAAHAKTISDDTWQNVLGLFSKQVYTATTKSGKTIIKGEPVTAARLGAELARTTARGRDEYFAAAAELESLALSLERGVLPNEKLSTVALDFLDRGIGRRVDTAMAKGDKSFASSLLELRRDYRGSGLDADTGLNVPRTLYAQYKAVGKAAAFGEKAAGKTIPLREMKSRFVAEQQVADDAFEEGIGEGASIIDTALMQGWIRGAENFIEAADNPQTAIRQLYGSERQREKLLAMMRELPEGASSGLKADNTKRIKALVGSKPGEADYKYNFKLSTGKRLKGKVEAPSLFARQKAMLESERQVVGSSVTGNVNEAMENQLRQRNSVETLLTIAENAYRSPARTVARVIDTIRAPRLLRDPAANEVIGEMLVTRGRDRLLALIDEIRARKIARDGGSNTAPPTGPRGAPPAIPPPAGPIRAGGFAGFGGKKPKLEDTKTIPEAAAVLSERFKPRKATRAATEQDWEQASEEAFDLLREQARKQDGFEPGARVWREKAPDSLTDPKAPPRFVFEDLAQSILRSRGIDPDPVYGRMLAERPTNAETDVFRKTARHYAGKARAAEREGMALDEMDDTDAAIEQMSSIKPPSRLNGLSGLRTDAGNAAIGGGLGYAGDIDRDGERTWKDAAIGGGGMTLAGRIPVKTAGKTATAGVPKTPAQAAGFGGGGRAPRLGRPANSASQQELPKAPAQTERQTGRPVYGPTPETPGWYRRVWGRDGSDRNGSSWLDAKGPKGARGVAARIAQRIAQTRPDLNVGRAVTAPGRKVASGLRAIDRRLRAPEDPRLIQPTLAKGEMRIPASGSVPTNRPAIERMKNPGASADTLSAIQRRAEKAYGKEKGTGVVPGRADRALDTLKKTGGYMRSLSDRLDDLRAQNPNNRSLAIAAEARKTAAARYAKGMDELRRLIVSDAPADQIAKVQQDVVALRDAMKTVIEKPKRAPGLAQLERIDVELQRAMQDVADESFLFGPSGRQIRQDNEVADLLTNPARAPDAARVSQAKPLGSHELKGQVAFWGSVGATGALAAKVQQDEKRKKSEDYYAKRDRWDVQTKDVPSLTGDSLKEVQTFLNYVVPLEEDEQELVVDGKFGSGTSERLRRYQKMRGLTVNGRRTWETIRDLEEQMSGESQERQPQKAIAR